MGRSRMVPRLENEDSNQSKSKRKKTVSSTEVTASPSTVGQELKDGKSALYHCNYCNKDLSGRIRMKCVACLDFDLCVECFSVGAELTPHKSNHPYRVMDNLSFPLLCPDWHADEEILLLEGIAMYGFGNWAEVAEFVGTKSKLQCFNHYSAIYMNSPCFPLPDLSHVMGKSREELLAMDTAPIDIKSEFPMAGELNEGSSLSARVKCEESRKEDSVHQTSSSGTAGSISGSTFSGAVKKTSKKPQIKDEIKHGASEAERSFSEKKPRVLGDNDPSMVELSGYNFKRQEFDIEYDNEAEHLLADMEFKDTDSEADRELKLKVLRIYFKRLDERKRRKDFILDRDLLYSDPFEKHLSSEERAICQSFKVFMRFHSRKDHEELLKNLLEEHRIVKRIQELQEARVAGCRTAVESSRFLEQKRKEAQESSKRVKESSQAIPSDTLSNHLKGENDDNPRGDAKKSPRLQGNDKEPSLATAWISSSIEDWDITGFVGADLLSETERRLCCEIRILPSHYLKMADTISVEILKGSVTKKSDVYGLFKVDPIKVDKVYDMVVKKGIAQVD